MNPKDEVKFEDIKKLVNASLEKFYKNDRDLIEMSNEEDMISEQCMVFHIGSYMKNKMNTLTNRNEKVCFLMKATGCKKIYNAENIIEAEMLVEMLKENGIAAFTQEPSSSVAAYGVAGFGVYGVDIWAEADEAEKAVQIIEEIEKSLDTENAE